MPSKSRRGKSKKKKRRQISASTATQQQPVSQTYEPVAPSVKEPTPMPAVARPPSIATELRRIGILAGIMLVTLVILALVLP